MVTDIEVPDISEKFFPGGISKILSVTWESQRSVRIHSVNSEKLLKIIFLKGYAKKKYFENNKELENFIK